MIANEQAGSSQPTIRVSIQKETELRLMMRQLGRVLVAYSGGVDSAYLAMIANEEVGDDAVCIMGLSPSVSEFQRTEAERIAKQLGLNFETIDTNEIDDPRYAANPANRCFYCKDELYSRLSEVARSRGIGWVLDGTNADDLADVRPGREAAKIRGVRSPLAELGFSKKEIRVQSGSAGLYGFDRPASPCLSSRIAHGVPVTIERLGRVEKAEAYLRAEGFREFRVRVHGELARVEVAVNELPRALEPATASKIGAELREVGFKFVTLDLEGFRSGSLNKREADIRLHNTTLEIT
jgi:pyridinium-3,5-biscarboxylic acid mononucleotide sulfurtransferase